VRRGAAVTETEWAQLQADHHVRWVAEFEFMKVARCYPCEIEGVVGLICAIYAWREWVYWTSKRRLAASFDQVLREERQKADATIMKLREQLFSLRRSWPGAR